VSKRQYISIKDSVSLLKYNGKTLYDLAEMYFSADDRKRIQDYVVVNRKPQKGFRIVVAFNNVEELKMWEIHKSVLLKKEANNEKE